MKGASETILRVRGQDPCLQLWLAGATAPVITLDLTVCLEHGRKFLPYDGRELLRRAGTDGACVCFPGEEMAGLRFTYADLQSLVFGDPLAVSEKVFAFADQADRSRLDPLLLLRVDGFPGEPGRASRLETAWAEGERLVFRVGNPVRPVVSLGLARALEGTGVWDALSPEQLLGEVRCGKTWVTLLPETTPVVLTWNDLYSLTFQGDRGRAARKILSAVGRG